MSDSIDYSIASSTQIETDLCQKLARIRLAKNMTQQYLAEQAGVSVRTIRRLEKGQGGSLDTFIRVLMALGVQQNLQSLLPDPRVRPIDRTALGGTERKRASSHIADQTKTPWSWGDEQDQEE